MNLYKTTGKANDVNAVLWSGSLADASKSRVAMKKSGGKNVETVEVDVPTSKQDLIAFLNSSKAGA